MNIFTLDFEIFWNSKDYTLSKMGPIEYVRDPRFTSQMAGVASNNAPVVVAASSFETQYKLLGEIDFDNDVVVGHNISGFDSLILSEVFGFRPKHIWDTICMMRWCGISSISRERLAALDEVLGIGEKKAGTVVSDGKRWPEDFTAEEQAFFTQYCADDVDQCRRAAALMLPYMTSDALKFMSLTARMATEPVFVLDEKMLEEYLKQLDAEAEEARQNIMQLFHFDTVADFLKALRSKEKFASMLRELGVEPPMKISEKKSATAGKDVWDYAFSKQDIDFLDLRDHEDSRVRLLVETRLEFNSSVLRSRCETLLKFARQHKPLPILLSAFKAHTSRYTASANGEHSSDGIQVQNLSKRNPAHLVLRRSIKAPVGYKIVACDSSQIEARMLAWLSRQEDLLGHFRDGRDPYAEFGVQLQSEGLTADDIHNGAKSGDKRCKFIRNLSKKFILSCLAGDTEILTDTGWKCIDTVSVNDKLWDGESWVRHQGLICNGLRRTVKVDGVSMTPDHLIWNGISWNTAGELLHVPHYMNQALRFGAASLKMCGLLTDSRGVKLRSTEYDVANAAQNFGLMNTHCGNVLQKIANTVRREMVHILKLLNASILTQNLVRNSVSSQLFAIFNSSVLRAKVRNVVWKLLVPAGDRAMWFCYPTLCEEKQRAVMCVLNEKASVLNSRNIGNTQMRAPMLNTGDGCLIASVPVLTGVQILMTVIGRVMGDEGLPSSSQIREAFLRTLSHCRDGIIRCWKLIEQIMQKAMRQGIYALSPDMRMQITGAVSLDGLAGAPNWKKKTQNCELVYDIMNSGPNNRFTIRTNSGALIVHNCGYGSGKVKVSSTLWAEGIRLGKTREEHAEVAARYLDIYRNAHSSITAFWRQCEKVIEHMVIGGSGRFGGPNNDTFAYGPMTVLGSKELIMSIMMPSGFALRYPGLRAREGDERVEYVYDKFLGRNRVATRLYSSLLTENLTQGISFQLLMWQACRMDEAGVVLKCNIHDAWATVVPDDKAEAVAEKMLYWMRQKPAWAAGCPIDAEVEIGTDFTVV